MSMVEHDFYTLQEAANTLRCEDTDILRWAGAGEIELHALFSGDVSYFEQEANEEGELVFVKEGRIRHEWVLVPAKTILSLYNSTVEEGAIAAHAYVPYFESEAYALKVSEDTPFSISLDSLHVKKKEFNRFKRKMLSKKPKQRRPGKEVRHLNKSHPFFAEHLGICVEAWEALYGGKKAGFSPRGGHKKYILDWLHKHYPKISDLAKSRIATVINPNPRGGASRTGN
ncbi:hypothetical protein ACFL2P_02785 [Candidatus Moduliflexota bacterium]